MNNVTPIRSGVRMVPLHRVALVNEVPGDYAGPRYCRPLPEEHFGRIFADVPNLYDSLEEQARIALIAAESRRDIRYLRVQAFVRVSCIVIALLSAAYFGAQLGLR